MKTDSSSKPITPEEFLSEARAGRIPVQGLRTALSEGLDANTVLDDGDTLLHKAAAKNQFWACYHLIKAGADVHAPNSDGRTALHMAFKHDHRMLGNLLLWKSVLTSMRQPEYQRAVRHARAGITAKRIPDVERALRISAMRRNGDALKTLLAIGTDPLATGPGGVSALHLAGLAGNADGVKLLLENEADPCQEDELGRTPADYALEADHLNLGKTLLDAENAKLAEVEAAKTAAIIASAETATAQVVAMPEGRDFHEERTLAENTQSPLLNSSMM